MDADVRAYIARAEGHFGGEPCDLGIDEERRQYVALCRAFSSDEASGVIARDELIDGRAGPVPIRIYRPAGGETQPCLLYLHGGGWVLGDLDSHHGECTDLATNTGVTVVAVDYRLAPEHPYPAAHEDCWDALTAIVANAGNYGIDVGRIAVAGDSAGGNIAAGLALRARDRGGPALAGQFLVYAALGGDEGLASYTEFADAPLLTTSGMKQYAAYYCGQAWFPDDPFLAPLKADDLSALPPTFLQPAAIDPLRDESVTYADRLREAGVDVELVIEEGLPHSFLRARHVTARGRAAFDRLCAAVKARLA